MRKLIPLLGLILLGCGVQTGHNPDPVDVTGRVTLAGKPVTDVVVVFLATGAGAQANVPVVKGELKGKVIPGKYTWYIEEGRNPSAMKGIPDKYKQGAMDRQVDIATGTTLDLKLD